MSIFDEAEDALHAGVIREYVDTVHDDAIAAGALRVISGDRDSERGRLVEKTEKWDAWFEEYFSDADES